MPRGARCRDPFDDKLLPMFYSADNVVQGKAAAKAELRKRLNLGQKDVPIVGVVSRLTGQKGINLMKHAMYKSLERGGQVVLLGSAPDPKVQADFERMAGDLKTSHWDQAALVFKFDEPLSHLVYAGADMLLVPSIFEPCGLSQLIAMRYGAIPIVRKTGGLNDTVFDVDHDKERATSAGVEPNGCAATQRPPASNPSQPRPARLRCKSAQPPAAGAHPPLIPAGSTSRGRTTRASSTRWTARSTCSTTTAPSSTSSRRRRCGRTGRGTARARSTSSSTVRRPPTPQLAAHLSCPVSSALLEGCCLVYRSERNCVSLHRAQGRRRGREHKVCSASAVTRYLFRFRLRPSRRRAMS